MMEQPSGKSKTEFEKAEVKWGAGIRGNFKAFVHLLGLPEK